MNRFLPYLAVLTLWPAPLIAEEADLAETLNWIVDKVGEVGARYTIEDGEYRSTENYAYGFAWQMQNESAIFVFATRKESNTFDDVNNGYGDDRVSYWFGVFDVSDLYEVEIEHDFDGDYHDDDVSGLIVRFDSGLSLYGTHSEDKNSDYVYNRVVPEENDLGFAELEYYFDNPGEFLRLHEQFVFEERGSDIILIEESSSESTVRMAERLYNAFSHLIAIAPNNNDEPF